MNILRTRMPVEILQPADFEPVPEAPGGDTIPALFERTAERHPDSEAVNSAGMRLSYRELKARADALARRLHASLGAGTEPVAMLMDHDVAGIVAMLGIMKSGRPYLPLDTSYPAQRVRNICRQAGVVAVLTDALFGARAREALADLTSIRLLSILELDLTQPGKAPQVPIDPLDGAMILYTSGSTGEPKGVWYSHRRSTSLYLHEANEWHVSPSDRMPLLGHLSFGLSRSTVLPALFTGAAICMFNVKAPAAQPVNILQWLEAERISMWRGPQTLFQTLASQLADDQKFEHFRLVGIGGQAITRRDFDAFRLRTRSDCVFMNGYASTEVGPVSRYYMTHDTELRGDRVPVGYAWPGIELRLVDEDGAACASGQRGEVLIISDNDGIRYHNDPERTAARFREDPQDPARIICHSGDFGVMNEEGALELLGREDSQVKIRGYRVEIQEVEAALRAHPDAREVVVVARAGAAARAEQQLTAYVVPRTGRVLDPRTMRDFATSRLPSYMVPTSFVFLEALPLNPNGKVDRLALPRPAEAAEPSASEAPADAVESQLTGIWRSVLGVQNVGVTDNFFDLGGDSLSVLSMILEVERALGRRVPAEFFRQPTIRGMARLMQQPDLQPQAPEPPAAFTLQAQEAPPSAAHWREGAKSGRFSRRLRMQLRQFRNTYDEVFLFEWLFGRLARGRTYDQVVQAIRRLAEQPILTRSVYARKQRLFRSFVVSVGGSAETSALLFGRNLISDMLLRLVEARQPFGNRPPSTLSRDRGRIFARTRPADLEEYFPVEGMRFLEEAYARARGVILLSMHGTADFRTTYAMLARRLGVPAIQVIAQRMSRRGSYADGYALGHNAPAAIAGSLAAEIAFHGQALLRLGQVIHIAADEVEVGRPGVTHALRIGDRRYNIRAGFAELALNTGALVLPVYGRFLGDGRLVLTIGQAFEPGTGTRLQQIEALVRQYEAFANQIVSQHPEIINWKKIRNHLKLPRSSAH